MINNLTKYKYDLQGAKATTNILNVSKLAENHLKTKKYTIFTPFICLFDDF